MRISSRSIGPSQVNTVADLTIVIPTKNRTMMLRQLLGYHARLGCPYTLMIGDSSDPRELEQNQEMTRQFRGRLSLAHMPTPPAMTTDEGIDLLLERSTTPYTVYCGDDDYLVPARLKECVEFLEDHPGYNLACGVSVWVWARESTGGGLEIWQAKPGAHKPIRGETPTQRMFEWAYPTQAYTSFSVQRTPAMREHCHRAIQVAAGSRNKAHYALREVLYNVLSVMEGKQVCLPGLYHVMVRHGQKYYATDSSSLGAFGRMTQWDWPKEVVGMIASLVQELRRREGTDPQKAQDIAEGVFLTWLQHLIARSWQRRLAPYGLLPKATFSKKTLRQLAADLPGLRPLWNWARRHASSRSEVSLTALLNPRSIYHEDFMPIYQAVTTMRSSITVEGRGPVMAETKEALVR